MTTDLASLLSEGLDLCVRARNLDGQVQRAALVEAGLKPDYFPAGTRCGTPALWAQEQYDNDLADWESRAKAVLTSLDFQI